MSRIAASGTLAIASGLLPVLTAVVGGLWGLYVYLDQQREFAQKQLDQSRSEFLARQIDARKPFLEKQLALYQEIVKLSGMFLVLDPVSKEWKDAKDRYDALLYSEAAMLVDQDAGHAMWEFRNNWIEKRESGAEADRRHGNVEAFNLARTIRTAIQRSWSLDPQSFGQASRPAAEPEKK